MRIATRVCAVMLIAGLAGCARDAPPAAGNESAAPLAALQPGADPGMPQGSPGMEQGATPEPYDVLLAAKDGSTTVYAHHGG